MKHTSCQHRDILAIWLLCSICWSAVPVKCANTDVAFKKEIDGYFDTISARASTFMDLLRESKVFIDNTLLISDLLKNLPASKTTLWLAPSKWGKSINLNMVKTYFHRETDDNGTIIPTESTEGYKLFFKDQVSWHYGKHERLEKPLLLSKDKELIKTTYGSSPVIHISFKNATGSNSTIIKQRIQLAIRQAFEQYQYVLDKLETKFFDKEKDIQKFKLYLNDSAGWRGIKDSIPLLCKVVGEEAGVYDANVIILIDDYDAPIIHYLQNDYPLDDDLNEVFRFLIDLIPFTFNHKYIDKCLRFAIVTGRFKIEYHEYDREYYLADKEDSFSEYFGFHQDNVKLLFSRHNVNAMLSKQAFQWYGGYELHATKKQFCNPSSIVKFLQTKRIESYFRENQDDLFLLKMFKLQPAFLDSILLLLSKQVVQIQNSVELKFLCRPDFKEVLCEKQPKVDKNSTHEMKKFFTYLMNEGFIARSAMLNEARFPNLETTAHMGELVMTFYRKEHGIKQNLARNVAIRLRDVIRDSKNLTAFQEHLTILYTNVFTRSHKMKNIKAVTNVLNCVGLQLQDITKFVMHGYYFSMVPRSNVVIVDGKTQKAVVMEITYGSSADEAFKLAEKHDRVMKTSGKVREIRLIGINITPDGVAQIESKFLPKDDKKEKSASVE